MNRDMTVPCEEGFINIRVGAIIMRDGKFLMVGNVARPECTVKHFVTDER